MPRLSTSFEPPIEKISDEARYLEAVTRADRGETRAALEVLQQVLDTSPEHVAARELATLLAASELGEASPSDTVVAEPDLGDPSLPAQVRDRLATSSRIEALLGQVRDALAMGDTGQDACLHRA